MSELAPGGVRAQLRVGLRSMPALADHVVQDALVLPGAFCIDMARCIAHARRGRPAEPIRNVTFHRPIVLGAADTSITVEASDGGDGRALYAFRETHGGQMAARLEIGPDPSPCGTPSGAAFSIASFRAQAQEVIGAERFYELLRANGNRYGPYFRAVSALWRSGSSALARISPPRRDAGAERRLARSRTLDAMVQVLGFLAHGSGRTFVLRAIERVEQRGARLPDALWVHAALRGGAGGEATEAIGDVRAYDGAGALRLELSGVELALLAPAGAGEEAATQLVVAANFSAEPVEDALRFWGEHFGEPVRVRFAPYDQVFQQLLDPASEFRANRSGVNVVLLALEEWAGRERHATDPPGEERRKRCFGDRPRTLLPNGREIVHLNRYETDYLYREIFEDQAYLKHGIALPDDATVVDIGANIGLFSLFVVERCANAQIHAFEPAPAAYELLQANCEAWGAGRAHAHKLGVSDRAKTATLTCYEGASVFSGFYAERDADRQALQAVVRNTLSRDTSADGEAAARYAAELTAERLRSTACECRMTCVSDIVRENGIKRIDLLKIDAEKSELDILAGIGAHDWPKIRQIVIEVHDPSGEAVRRVQDLLGARGYRCMVEHERLLERSGLCNVYATRRGARGAARPRRAQRLRETLERNTRDLCAALESFSAASASPVILCLCPATPCAAADPELGPALREAERRLLASVRALPKLHAIGSELALRRYPVADYYDPHGHRLGQLLYTPAGYAALATAVYRALFALRPNRYKVIVLDCDNTLWKGACAEDGPRGIDPGGDHRLLQQFMLAQMNAGMLLCLCSKNDEKDVLEVFEQRSDMVLRREHFASWRVNWNRKSDNLRALAQELGLGLESFVFLDDNPLECAEVRINCPGVLALTLPPADGSLGAFLDQVWAFDRPQQTQEDRSRTRMYRENAQRERLRERSGSLRDFVEGLGLRVEIAAPKEQELARVSQLTFRTNQFNFSGLRRTQEQIRDFLARGNAACLAVRVADRFGDYGLVGVVLYEVLADRYRVDTLLLSCRVLGRGVEHEVLAQLGRRALHEHRPLLEIAFRPTRRNAPVRALIADLGLPAGDAADQSLSVEARRLARLRYDPEARGKREPAPGGETRAAGGEAAPGADRGPEGLRLAAEDLRAIEPLMRAIERFRLRDEPAPAGGVAPADTLEAALLKIWRRTLGRPRIGIDDNFFDAGGSSLKAVQVNAAIARELGRSLSIVTLFERPTVRMLAARLRADADEAAGEVDGAAQRGRRRRSAARLEAQ